MSCLKLLAMLLVPQQVPFIHTVVVRLTHKTARQLHSNTPSNHPGHPRNQAMPWCHRSNHPSQFFSANKKLFCESAFLQVIL